MNPIYDEIATVVIDCAIKIHRALGPGLYESVYETLLAQELQKKGLKVERQKPIPILFDGKSFDEGFRADLWIDPGLIVEVKSLEMLDPIDLKEMLTFLRVSDQPLGLIINFGEELLKTGLRRVINNPRKSAIPQADQKSDLTKGSDPTSGKKQFAAPTQSKPARPAIAPEKFTTGGKEIRGF